MYIPTILHSYTSNSNVYLTPSSPALLYSLPYPLPSIFAFFGLFMDAFFATITISHSYISSTIGFTSPHTTDYPILYPYPYCPPAPHFRFFLDYLWTPFATITFPHHYLSSNMIPEGPTLPRYSIPAPCFCLSP